MDSLANHERTILRDLAKRVKEIADLPVMAERRRLWMQHNSLKPVRPMILIFPEGSWQELLPESALVCESKSARRMERQLRTRIYYHEHFADDTVIEDIWTVGKAIRNTGWGLEAKRHASTEARGAWAFDPVIQSAADLKKIQMPEISHDEAASAKNLAEAQDLFGDILAVQQRGVTHISYHIIAQYTYWRGLTEMMMDMADNPGLVHEAMTILTEGHKRILKQYVDLNLLSLNNDNTYQNSGGNSWTTELPAADFDPQRVRPCDMWASAEAQELAQVSPDMHAELVMKYEKELLEPFGLTGYGCCEDLTRKLDDVKTIPHIRRISIAPSADVEKCAEQLGGDYIFSWKPQPSHLVAFNEAVVRDYIRRALDVTQGCVLEMVLKDTHTCENHPERFDRWSRIAREEVETCG